MLELSRLAVCTVASNRVLDGMRQGITMNNKHFPDFLAKWAKSAIAIDVPFFHDPDRTPIMTLYSGGKQTSLERFPLPRFLAVGTRTSSRLLYASFKVLDFVSALYFILHSRVRVDLFIGVEAIDTLSGLILRKLGRVRFVIYNVNEGFPNRYATKWINSLFVRLDLFCSKRADVVWNESDGIRDDRLRLWRIQFKDNQITVPYLNEPPEDANYVARSQHFMVFLGGLVEESGVQVAITALPKILIRVPDAEFHIIGKGKYSSKLESMTRELGLSSKVVFHGFLSDEQAKEVMSKCRVGLAPYSSVVSQGGRHYFDSSKTKYYACMGVPVILSSAAPMLARFVERYHTGVVIEPGPDALADAVCLLMTNQHFYEECLAGCRKLAEHFNSEKVLKDVVAKSLAILDNTGSAKHRPRLATVFQ